MKRAIIVVTLALIAAPALADPCKAIPDKGAAPSWLRRGATFAGPVVYVGDGDSLCLAVGPRAGADWVEVRLADFHAPELHEPGGPQAKSALSRIAEGRQVDCLADHRSYDRMVAICRQGGTSLGDLMRRVGVEEGGRGR